MEDAWICQMLQNEDCWSEIKMEKISNVALGFSVVAEVTAVPEHATEDKHLHFLSAQMSL